MNGRVDDLAGQRALVVGHGPVPVLLGLVGVSSPSPDVMVVRRELAGPLLEEPLPRVLQHLAEVLELEPLAGGPSLPSFALETRPLAAGDCTVGAEGASVSVALPALSFTVVTMVRAA